ncbi:MAG: CBS domain-containing protein [Planctomycetota bacterium]|nr:MAG: CBS domain-containing protein [Planctomycetota bacterium]
MEEYIEEEMQIMEERDTKPKTIDNELFQAPIHILCERPVESLPENATIGQAVRLMQEKKIGAIPIVENKKLVGIVSERDILMKVVGKMANFEGEPIEKIMTPKPSWLMKEDPICFAMNKMHMGGYRHVPIVNENMEPEHIISLRDVLGFILDHFPEDVLNMPPEPPRGEIPLDGG